KSDINDRKRSLPMEELRLSRRSFLKLTALSALTLGAGYTVGKLVPQSAEDGESRAFSLHAFLPGDSNLVSEVMRVFAQKTGPAARLTVSADRQWSEMIRLAVQPGHLLGGGLLAVRMAALPETLPADLLLGDNQQAVYSPEEDYDPALLNLRGLVRGYQAGYLFSAEYRHTSLLAGLLPLRDLFAVVRSGPDVVERIPLDRTYRQVVVNGPQGKTVLSMSGGAVQVQAAACRNKLCMHSGTAVYAGSVIACAPNRLVVQVEAG
ncbi:MAG TPA: NusG domain II-containing protein, partial [Levilinea sp.]|nr:NusG domain II-containing protein [Levilinea sp.]